MSRWKALAGAGLLAALVSCAWSKTPAYGPGGVYEPPVGSAPIPTEQAEAGPTNLDAVAQHAGAIVNLFWPGLGQLLVLGAGLISGMTRKRKPALQP